MEANNLYYKLNKERRVKREEKKRKETKGRREAQMLRGKRGVTQQQRISEHGCNYDTTSNNPNGV